MIISLNTDTLQLDPTAIERIKDNLSKTHKYLPNLGDDLHLELLIRRTRDKFHPKSRLKKHRDYLATKLKQFKFEGWIKLTLPKKVLYAKFQGLTVKGGVSKGLRSLIVEIKKYKELHFKSQSKYPSQETIRGRYD